MTAPVLSRDPRSGAAEVVAEETSLAGVERICAEAAGAAPWLEGLGAGGRAALLREIGRALEAGAERIVALAERETALGVGRLRGELGRAAGQFRHLAEVIEDGACFGVVVDGPDAEANPPRPELRRMLVPLGPVAVFGASNFPIAFSVPGGDTASAIAAGCPVVAKAHPAHPATSQACLEALRAAVAARGGPSGVVALVHGEQAGASLVRDPRIRAVGFTGSLAGGRALFDLASSRPDPIPFYGELGSLNPLVVTPAAAARRAEDVGAGLAGSVLLGLGQFCTKPGIAFVPDGADGERLVAVLREHLAAGPPGPLLTEAIRDTFRHAAREAGALPGVETLLDRSGAEGGAGPVLVRVRATALAGDAHAMLRREHFGPFAVVANYADEAELGGALGTLEPSLAATVHGEPDGDDLAASLLVTMRDRAGRIVWNGYPTGVAVTWAMTHGGPYPATTAPLHTSVGATAVARFLRPVTYQSVPEHLLPGALRDEALATTPHRHDGRLVR